MSGTGNTGWVILIVGNGTAGRVPLWVPQVSLGDSDIYQDSGNIGIGGVPVGKRLDVFGTFQASTSVTTPLLAATTSVTSPVVTSAASLTVNPSSNLILDPGSNTVFPQVGYDINLGSLQFKFLTLHAAELWVETLVAQNTIATIGGRVLVAPTNILVGDLSTVATTITVKYNNFANGDRAYMEAEGKVEFFAITSSFGGSAGAYTYTVTRDLDGSGANLWYGGDAMLNTGQTGNGFIDIYSVRGIRAGTEIGPTIVGNIRNSSTYNDWSPRWAIGNLDGLYGYSGSTYGAAFGNSAATNVTVDATNGFRIRNSTTNKFVADTAGNLSIVGDLTVGTAGTVHSAGATAYGTGTGFWIAGGATPVFRVGNPAGNRLSWDGTTLTVAGEGSGVTNIDGGNIQANTITVGQINATGFGNNIIRNGRFEGPSLIGWAEDSHTGPGGTVVASTGGIDGPGALVLPPTASYWTSATYLAAPVKAGEIYFISFDVWVGANTAGGLYVYVMESTTNTGTVRRVLNSGASSPDVTKTSSSLVCNNCPLSSGWQRVTYTYTVPAGVLWAGLNILNDTGPSTYSDMWVDGVEMQLQIGPGHITANSITAGQIAADAITTSELAADSVTSAKIVAGTIVASDIAANTLTANEIAANAVTTSELNADSVTSAKIVANTIVAADIAAGTITATEIAAGTITADRMNVSTLSAIAANLGTVTAGDVTVGSTQKLWLNVGTDPIFAVGGTTRTTAPFRINDEGDAYALGMVIDNLNVTTTANLGFLAGGGTQPVCVNNSGYLTVTCVEPAPLGLIAQIEALKIELAALRAEVTELRSVTDKR